MDNLNYRPNMGLQTAEERQMGLFLHLSELLYVFVFPLGAIAPILLWQMNKDKMPALDAHGKMVVNWMISSLIYGVISFVLAFVIIGFFMLIALGIVGIVFPIIGAIKANNGEMWEYPLTIKFIK
ncbi:MAG TPA: DUF4870 domain-containing protein [Pyrinomonadaceae bacterium]|nr:DUF4870 domain-containing protein [Pyrinomonadaceae bacterium]